MGQFSFNTLSFIDKEVYGEKKRNAKKVYKKNITKVSKTKFKKIKPLKLVQIKINSRKKRT